MGIIILARLKFCVGVSRGKKLLDDVSATRLWLVTVINPVKKKKPKPCVILLCLLWRLKTKERSMSIYKNYIISCYPFQLCNETKIFNQLHEETISHFPTFDIQQTVDFIHTFPLNPVIDSQILQNQNDDLLLHHPSPMSLSHNRATALCRNINHRLFRHR